MFVTASTELKFHQWPENFAGQPYSQGITSEIVSLSWSKSNSYIIYLQRLGKPEILSVKDLTNIKPIHTITAIDHATAVAFQKNTKKVVAIGTSSSTVALYDTSNRSILKLFTLPAAVTHLDFNVTDEYLGVACVDGSVSLLNIVEGAKSGCHTVGSQASELKFHPVLPLAFAVGTKDGALFISKINPAFLEGCHFGSINGIAFDVKQNRLLTVGEDRKFCVYDMDKNTCIYTSHLQFPLTSMDISPDGKHIAIGTDCGWAYMFEAKYLLTHLLKWTPHEARVKFIKFSNALAIVESAPKHYLSEESINTIDSATSPEKLQQEIEFKSLYNKFINHTDYEAVIGAFRDKILEDIRKNVKQVYVHMNRHMASLQDLMAKEFAKMNEQMDDKWNFLIDAEKFKANDDGVDRVFDNDDEPIILE